MSNPVETYIRELWEIRSTGAAVKETSYYGALANLLNEVGKTLKPKVRCVINLANQGKGLPDGGLFTPDQFQRASEAEPLPGQLPSRGAIEIKGTGDNAEKIAASAQVDGYWKVNGQVLVTNYRDFVLVGKDAQGKKTTLEAHRLADSEAAFWQAARNPQAVAEEQGERFTEYPRGATLHDGALAELLFVIANRTETEFLPTAVPIAAKDPGSREPVALRAVLSDGVEVEEKGQNKNESAIHYMLN